MALIGLKRCSLPPLAFRVMLIATASGVVGAEVIAQDSARAPWTASQLQGTPEPPEPFQIVRAFESVRFERPSSLEEIPGGRLMVTEMGGKIFTIPKDGQTPDLLADLSSVAGGPVSLFSATLHPQFTKNRYLFACLTHPQGGRHTRVSRFTLTNETSPSLVAGSEQVLLTWPAGGHNGGCLRFGKDGFLYISTGDGSGPNPPDGLTTGQDVSDLLGSILRIDVDRPSGANTWSVPADNPFVKVTGARPEVWAYGLRNPWKFGIDAETGEIFAADNGWESWEMVHRIVRGGNCGWPIREGRADLRTEVPVGPTPMIPPVKDHPHSEANSVIGGPVYRGSVLQDLHGWFVYGDYITGTIWALQTGANGTLSQQTLVDTDLRIVDFAEGRDGELYVLDHDYTGGIYEVRKSDVPDLSARFPRRLSRTGLFQSLSPLQPAAGVEPYEVKVEPWMDGAIAQRWVAIPGRARITLDPAASTSTNWPDGTVLVRHLSLPSTNSAKAIPLETQLLHIEGRQWRPYSYVWNDLGTEAELADLIGADRTLRLGGDADRTWHVGAQNECRLCHNAAAGFVLGFVPSQLDTRDNNGRDQLASLTRRGVLDEQASAATFSLVDPHDSQQDLNDRARSWLHVNCSMCHHPRGTAIVSFYLRRDMPFERLNTNKGTGIGTFGMRDAKVLVSGDPYRSVLFYRISKLGNARMPYIGSQVVDSRGVALIEEWIRSLPRDPQGRRSLAGEDEATALRLLSASEGTEELRSSAVRKLLESTEGSLALAARMHAGELPEAEQLAVAHLSAQVPGAANIRGLFEHFLPESQRRTRLGPVFDPATVLSLKGDPARGRLIFFSDSARCRTCHDLKEASRSLGPTLTETVRKYSRASELLQQITKPSLKVDDKFATWSVVTTAGRATSGLMVEQTDRAVVLKDARQQIVRVAREDVDDLRKSDVSLMPERLLSDLTAQEAADLLAWLRSL